MTAAPDGQPSGPAPTAGTSTLRRSSRWLAAVPRHVGRARTSTLVLSLLFLAIGALYLTVHRTTAQPTNPTGVVVAPVPVDPTTSSRARSTAPTTPSSTPATSTGSASTSSTEPSAGPTTTAPAGTPSPTVPATTSSPVLPTAVSTSAAPTS